MLDDPRVKTERCIPGVIQKQLYISYHNDVYFVEE